MKRARFFALVWRLNALIILLAGTVGLLVLVYAAIVIFNDLTRTRHASGIINIAEEQIDTTRTSLGDFELVEGTPILRAPLYLHQEYAFSSGSKAASSTQNYLYFDSLSRAPYWLMPGNRGLILETKEFPSHEYGEKAEPTRVVMYLSVDSDSNGDGKLTSNDAKSIAISDPTGKRFASLLGNVEQANGAQLLNDSLLIFYTSEGSLRVAEIDLATTKLVSDAIVKTLKHEVQSGNREP